MSQISGAACLALDSMNAISEGIAKQDAALGDKETSGETGPYIPSYVDVLLAHMFGNDAAIALRRAKMTGDEGKSVDSVLAAHVPPDQMAALLDFRAGLLRDHDTKEVETVDGMLINADRLLNDEFRKAFNLMTELIPEDMPKLDGAAPWLAPAETEEKLWAETLVKEDTPGGRERVLQYSSGSLSTPAPSSLGVAPSLAIA